MSEPPKAAKGTEGGFGSWRAGRAPSEAILPIPSDQPGVVALVCSAGGLDPVTTILERLPADLPAAVIVLQHVRPRSRGMLAQILAPRCACPVREARHGDPLIEGHVYTVPPGRHALVTIAGTIALIDSDGSPPYRPSADLLLTSLALTCGRRAVAVILSGSGNDGATGAVAIHEFGGTVIAADETSSKYFAMPAAAIGRDDAVDAVLPVAAIADAIEALLPTSVARSGPSPDVALSPVSQERDQDDHEHGALEGR